MFKEPTVLVLGAGASYEVGFPLGAGLVESIVSLTRADGYGSASELYTKVADQNLIPGREANKFCRAMNEGLFLSRSIDSYLESHKATPQIVQLGKIAIADIISRFESKSCVGIDDHRRFKDRNKIEQSWYHKLFVGITEGLDAATATGDDIFKNLTIITFNYDRSFEFFLYRALITKFLWDEQRAMAALETMPVYHMYGSLGDNWLDFGRPFDLSNASRQITTYTEKREDVQGIDQVQRAMADASTVIFLGFAFHKPNVKLIAPEPKLTAIKRFYATTKGVSASAQQDWFQRVFDDWYEPSAVRAKSIDWKRFSTMQNGTCAALFDEFQTNWFD